MKTAKQQFLDANLRDGEVYGGIVLGQNGEPKMTKIEALELELAARKMVEGTGLDWKNALRLTINNKPIWGSAVSDYHIEELELALGIIEYKPVWEDDTAYCGGEKVTVHSKTCFNFRKEWSWSPPKPKTVMVELPVKHVEYWDSQGEFLRSALEPKPLDVKSMTFYAACHKALEQLK